MYGSAFGIRTRRNNVTRPAAYERISSIDEGWTDVSPRSVLIITGKKQSTAAIAIFENGLSGPNQLFMIGAKAMIGIGIRGDCVGHERARERPPGGEEERNENADAAAEHVPAERFLEGVDPAWLQSASSGPRTRARRRRLRKRNP